MSCHRRRSFGGMTSVLPAGGWHGYQEINHVICTVCGVFSHVVVDRRENFGL